MKVMGLFIGGFFSVVKIIGTPLMYRYPYRTSAEGLRSDWMNIGKDIESVIGRLKAAADYERE